MLFMPWARSDGFTNPLDEYRTAGWRIDCDYDETYFHNHSVIDVKFS